MRSITLLATLAALLTPASALAFCGFYVAKADSALFNQASKVVLARHDGKTVITMVNDYQGALQEFALVVPVPSVLERGQIHVTEHALVDHLDAYSAPRLVEDVDGDPCRTQVAHATSAQPAPPADDAGAAALGVTIEAEYTVSEYDIVILSAEQSAGLLTWLRQQGYQLPAGAGQVVDEYLAAGMRFFLAKVNLAEQSKLGYSYLRPLQIAFESEHFMLPIRLGMVNATGPQELLLLLTRDGRVRAANYQTMAIPTDVEVPLYVENQSAASTPLSSIRRWRARTAAARRRCSWSTPGTWAHATPAPPARSRSTSSASSAPSGSSTSCRLQRRARRRKASPPRCS